MRSHGAVGLIVADGCNMLLRIAYCLRFIAAHFATVRGHGIGQLFPGSRSLLALAAASALANASNWLLLGGKGAAAQATSLPQMHGAGFLANAGCHVVVGSAALAGVMLSLYRFERQLLRDIIALKNS